METLHKMHERDARIDDVLGNFYHKVIGGLLDDKQKGRAFLIGLIIAFLMILGSFQ